MNYGNDVYYFRKQVKYERRPLARKVTYAHRETLAKREIFSQDIFHEVLLLHGGLLLHEFRNSYKKNFKIFIKKQRKID